MSIPEFEEIIEPNDQTAARAEHLTALRELVGNVYPNKFARSRITGEEDTITRIVNFDAVTKHIPELDEGERPSAEVKDAANAALKEFGTVRIAGRLATPPRLMGKAAFVHLSDGMWRLQVYVRKDDVQGVNNETGETVNGWELFQLLDHGDFIGVEGFLFITNTGELSVHVEKVQFLSKAMLPMPDKMHGIVDPEIRQRQRYADLIASSLQIEHDGKTTREVFETRAKVISSLRRFLEDHGYIEVETPMLTPKATGAAAKPFETHHNALDITLYARIAPELYLKRLLVGGFEKVYELNRNFRNEGISYKHNPEFTMLEFYCAYMDVNGMMDFCEQMLRETVQKATGGLTVEYKGKTIDFSNFDRVTMKEAIIRYPIKAANYIADDLQTYLRKRLETVVDDRWMNNPANVRILRRVTEWWIHTAAQEYLKIKIEFDKKGQTYTQSDVLKEFDLRFNNLWSGENMISDVEEAKSEEEYDQNILSIFENAIEQHLEQPTFIVDFPKSISPLSKASPENPKIAERFELFINGMEVANGFSELNDPKEQYERFIDQMKERERGNEEAMVLDEDYIRALSYGMPPAAGIGIGIDRLVMLLTNKHSIRDVILFPHLRPERKDVDKEE